MRLLGTCIECVSESGSPLENRQEPCVGSSRVLGWSFSVQAGCN